VKTGPTLHFYIRYARRKVENIFHQYSKRANIAYAGMLNTGLNLKLKLKRTQK
jgi:hypothetical protein